MDIQIRQATVADIDPVSPLFDAYRQFYGKPSDLQLAHTFLKERFEQHESILFVALVDEREIIGFVQLYPSFSSVSAARTFILNDLFVVPEARRSGVARRLIEAAASYGRSVGAVRLSLSTGVDNTTAQSVYGSLGWLKDAEFIVYHLPLS